MEQLYMKMKLSTGIKIGFGIGIGMILFKLFTIGVISLISLIFGNQPVIY
jgi:hypothetical protein